MAITFHCDHCGKKIEAKDAAGGKWAKCPVCHNKIYVPNPSAEEADELKLSPIDETEQEKKRQLMRETYTVAQDILSEKEAPSSPTEPSLSQSGQKELTKNIILFLKLMADGQLGEAEAAAKLIVPHKFQAERILDGIAVSEMPEPELTDIPQQVLSGLIRSLRKKLR